MKVDVRQRATRHPTDGVKRDARRLLEAFGMKRGELSVVLCDDAVIHALNRRWRQVDGPTDVLSFPMQEGDNRGINADILGDIVISIDTAARQAAEQGHPLETEVRVLLVHGFLHLCGHDHHEDAEAAEMRAEEASLLGILSTIAPGLVARAGR